MAFNIKVIVEAEAVESSSEITQDYGLSESMMRCWRRDQVTVRQCGQYTLYINYNIFPGFLVTLTVDLSVLSTYCKSSSVISSQGDTFTVELID